jgi:hypothetical protein
VSTTVNVKNKPKQKTNFLDIAVASYGDGLPDWIEALARLATDTSATAAAKKIGYSSSLLSALFRGSYSGDFEKLEQKVRGVLMGVNVECPVLGEIGADQCLDEQGKKHVGTSAIRTSLYHACRNGCPHSRIVLQGGDADAA